MRGNILALQAYFKKQEKSQINTLTLFLKELKKKKKDGIKPNLGRRKEIIKIRAEINDIETKKHKISMKPRTGSLKKLTRLTNLALARWLGCVKCCLVHQKVAGFISCQGIYLGSGFDP